MIDWKTITLKELAGFISEELRKRGIEIILVGGACVTIYSQNRYQSYDLDFITYDEMKRIKKALKELEFIEKDGYFQHKDCKWFVEFVSPPIAVGNEPIHKFNNVDTLFGKIKMLRPTDSVKDRLSNFYHWNDEQALEQAINICLEQKIDLDEVKQWSIQELQEEKFDFFKKSLRKISH